MEIELYKAKGNAKSVYLGDVIAAHVPGVRHELMKEAAIGAGKASVILGSHRDKGESHISIRRGTKLDYFVTLSDRGGGAWAVQSETGALTDAFGLRSNRKPKHRGGKQRKSKVYIDDDDRGT